MPTKERYWKDPETHRERTRKWLAANPEKKKKQRRQYLKENREKVLLAKKQYREQNKAKVDATIRAWRNAHQEKVRGYARLYAQRKRSAIVTIDEKNVAEILGAGCFFCGAHRRLELAHNIALAKGGMTTKANIFCLCRSCNAKMRTLSLAEMLEQRTFLP